MEVRILETKAKGYQKMVWENQKKREGDHQKGGEGTGPPGPLACDGPGMYLNFEALGPTLNE